MATLNPFDPDFKLSVCDGPRMPGAQPDGYVACDFAGLMLQIQFLINAMIILGVLGVLITITWAGWLLITGGPREKDRAKEMFRKAGIGFILMLGGWFIVYQILDWFAANPAVKSLLGSP